MTSARLDLDDPQQPFKQVAAKIRAAIDDGDLRVGDQLKSIRTLAGEHGVSTGTVQRAVRQLREEGLVTSWQGRGAFVRRRPGDPEPDGLSELAELRRIVESLADRVAALEQRRGAKR